MNFLTLRVFDGDVRFLGGALDGRPFHDGDAVFINGDTIWSQREIPPIQSLECGFWILHCTVRRGHPSVLCSYFNKRTQLIEERYHKILYTPGVYRCGPRFPRLMERFKEDRSFRRERFKKAA